MKTLDETSTVIQIDVKQAIYFIREAWREVSSQTIENCWRKTKIADCSNMSECIEKIREEKEQIIEKIAEDFEKIKNLSIVERLKQFEYTPRQYVSADDDEVACASLTDEEIVDIVLQKESEEELEEMTEEVETKSNMFSSKESLKSLDGLLNYFEDKEAIDESILDALNLLKLKAAELLDSSKKQTKIDTFFM